MTARYDQFSDWCQATREDDEADERARIEDLRRQLIALPAFRRDALEHECCDAIAEATDADAAKLAIDRAVERWADACIADCTNKGDVIGAIEYLIRINFPAASPAPNTPDGAAFSHPSAA